MDAAIAQMQALPTGAGPHHPHPQGRAELIPPRGKAAHSG